jgi:hypothetical protein
MYEYRKLHVVTKEVDLTMQTKDKYNKLIQSDMAMFPELFKHSIVYVEAGE